MTEDPDQRLIKKIFNFILKIFKMESNPELKSKIHYLKRNHHKMSFRERYLLRNFMGFNSKNADNVLIPRSEICAIDINISIDQLFSIIRDTYNTRILVYDGNLDDIKGYIHIKDILVSLIDGNKSIKISEIIRKPIIATHSTKLTNILVEMQNKSTHIAIILDEYGCTDGIVTFEDIMESLVGNIEDEHDEKDNVRKFEFVNNNTIMSFGDVKINEIEEAIGFSLKEDSDNCDTIGGLVIARAGKLPKKGSFVDITKNVKAKIIETSPKSIKKINLILNQNFGQSKKLNA